MKKTMAVSLFLALAALSGKEMVQKFDLQRKA